MCWGCKAVKFSLRKSPRELTHLYSELGAKVPFFLTQIVFISYGCERGGFKNNLISLQYGAGSKILGACDLVTDQKYFRKI